MTGHLRSDARKRLAEDTTSRTEAEAARAAQILGRHEYIGGGAEVNVPTPLCSVCQGAVNGFVCGACERDAS